jgi:hypothetical protein
MFVVEAHPLQASIMTERKKTEAEKKTRLRDCFGPPVAPGVVIVQVMDDARGPGFV